MPPRLERHLGLEHLQGAKSAPGPVLDVVLGVPAVDDHRGGADLGGGVAGLLQDLARAVSDVVARRADVDQVGRVDVEGQARAYERAPGFSGDRAPPLAAPPTAVAPGAAEAAVRPAAEAEDTVDAGAAEEAVAPRRSVQEVLTRVSE